MMAPFPRIVPVLALSLFLISARPPQDPEAEFDMQVRSLIVLLKDRNVATRKKAEEDLFQLGARAVPILRVEEARLSPGDLKQRLLVVIKRIERVQRKAVASGSTLMVTLSAKEKPIPEVFSELEKMTAVPIEHRAVPAGAVTTLEAEGLSLWEAVDKICAAHGRLNWDVSEKGISIRRETYARPLMATFSGFVFIFRTFVRHPPGPGTGDREYLRSESVVAGPPGAVSIAEYLTYEALVDDKGTNLLTSASGLVNKPYAGVFRGLPEPDPTRPLFGPVADLMDSSPAKNAKSVKTCKGVAVLRSIVEMEKRFDVRAASLKKGGKETGFGVVIEIESFDTSGGRVRMDISITDTRIGDRKGRKIYHPLQSGRIVLRGAGGIDLAASMEPLDGAPPGPPPPGTNPLDIARFRVQATLKADATLASLEYWEPLVVDEIKIPFDLKDVPIRKAK